MGNPFDREKWKDAIVLDVDWSGAPGRSGHVSMAILETATETQFWQWDDETYTRAKILARHPGKYEIRKASRIISSIEEGGACACALSDIIVRGETGWRADLLAIAWYRDGENDCLATPLVSILVTLSDDELRTLRHQRETLRDEDLIAVSYCIGELREGTSSVLPLLQKSLASLSECKTEDRPEVLGAIEEEAAEWVREEYQRKLAPFADQYRRAILLKEFEFLSAKGKRAMFAQQASRFRTELEHSIYVDGKLSDEARRALAADKATLLDTSATLDDAFSREELEEMTNYPPPLSIPIRGRILRAWARADPLPFRFGSCAPQSISSSDSFRFLRWLLEEDVEATLLELKALDPGGARNAVERVLKIALPSAQRLLKPGSFSGGNAGMARGLASGIAHWGRKVQAAAGACGIGYDPALQIPSL